MVIDKVGLSRSTVPVATDGGPVNLDTAGAEHVGATRGTDSIHKGAAATSVLPVSALAIDAAPSAEAVVARAIAQATEPLRGLTAVELHSIESVLRDQFASDPMFLELLAQATELKE